MDSLNFQSSLFQKTKIASINSINEKNSDSNVVTSFLKPIYLEQLMKAGVHYGHQVQYWNPKMSEFIYTEKNGVHILNLLKTISCLQTACQYVFKASQMNKTFLFVGTKYQASKLIANQAQKCGAFYINKRWLGGMLTNWSTMQTRIEMLNSLEQEFNENKFSSHPKKQAAVLMRQLTVLQNNLGGVKCMTRVPDVVIIVDQNREYLAVSECRKLNIPIISLVDSNCNPDFVDFPIPANDDAQRSINYVLTQLTDSILAAKDQLVSSQGI